MTNAYERYERLQRANEFTVRHIIRHVAPYGLRAFFLLVAYAICVVRALAYAVQEPFLRYRDRLLNEDANVRVNS